MTAYVAPIGGYPVAVMTEPSLTDHYEVDVPEGCHFEVEGTFGRTETADMPVTSWAWTVPQASAGLVAVENETAIPLVGFARQTSHVGVQRHRAPRQERDTDADHRAVGRHGRLRACEPAQFAGVDRECTKIRKGKPEL